MYIRRWHLFLLCCLILTVIAAGCSTDGVRITDISPSREIPRHTNITLTFSDDIVPPDQVNILA